MRITFVTRRYWPAIGGVERVAMSLGERLVAQGHEVRVVAQCVDEGRFGRMTHIIRENKPFAAFVHNGVEVVQFRPSRLRRSALLPFALELIPLAGRLSNRRLRRHTSGYYSAVVGGVLVPLLGDADVVHVLGGEVLAVAAVHSARRCGLPVAVSPFAHPGEWGLDSGSIRGYREADLVIATTQADADVYRSIGVPEARLSIVGLPVPALTPAAAREQLAGTHVVTGPHMRPADSPSLADLEAEGERRPLVVFLGARRPTKGVEILLAAAPFVWRRHPHARFAFVGPGAALVGDDARLLDVGPVSDAERTLWLDRADVLCLPSVSESFGLVVPEAWSQSTPVVVSDIPVLRELVEVSGGGVLAEREPSAMAEAICSLLNDPERARLLGIAGHEYWQRELTPDAVAARHVAIYRALAGARSSA